MIQVFNDAFSPQGIQRFRPYIVLDRYYIGFIETASDGVSKYSMDFSIDPSKTGYKIAVNYSSDGTNWTNIWKYQ